MANIATYLQDSTVQAIYAGIVANNGDAPRQYLGASSIGHSCKRALWLSFRQVRYEAFSGRMLRLFNTGHLEEPRMVEDLRNAGVEVHEVDPITHQQWAISYHGGHFRGHADGVALGIKDAPNTWHLLEFKTHSEKSFNLLTSKGVAQSKPMHYDQMQVYMHGLSLSRAYYLARNKNTDELYGERIKYDAVHATKLIAKAESIIYAPEPMQPISNKPDWYECKMCSMHPYCHAGVTALPEPMPNLNCRTCINSTPERDGGWSCAVGSTIGTVCSQHRFIPMLFPGLEFTHASGVDGSHVFYKHASTGDKYVNASAGEVTPC